MATGARFRNTPDVLRMGRAMRQPGIDSRVWSTGGRVGEEGNTVRWDADIGWVVDIVCFGGGFSQDVITARVATNHPNEFIPLNPDCEVNLSVPEGEAEGIPAIVGTLNNQDGCEAPGEVTGIAVDGSIEVSTTTYDGFLGLISPYDTEFKTSPNNRREEYDGYYIVKASDCVVEGGQLRFAGRDATQSFVRGEEFIDAILVAFDLILPTYGNASGTIVPTPLTDAALEAADAALQAALSERIKGE